jgi:hypothetical protein
MSRQFSNGRLLCRADRHVLVVVSQRRPWRFWTKVSFLQCLCCDLKLGPLRWRS